MHVFCFRHLRCQRCPRRFSSIKGLSMYHSMAHGPSFPCFWCTYTVESRRFDNLRRHAEKLHPKAFAETLKEFPTFKAAYKARFPDLFRRDPRKMSVPQPPTPPKVKTPIVPKLTLPLSPLLTPVTDEIYLDAEVQGFMDVESPTFRREIYQGYDTVPSTLNTPIPPALSPVECPLVIIPEPVDIAVTIPNIPEKPSSPMKENPLVTSDPKGYLAALMDSHRDRALSSSFIVRVMNSEHTMETVEEVGFKYMRLVTIVKGK